MNLPRLALRGVAHHRRMHLGLLTGTLLACAVLSGALVVGDSVRQTLRGIALARLGDTAHALDWGERHFTQDLAESLAGETGADTTAALAVRAMAGPPPGGAVRDQINRARVYGVDRDFWGIVSPGEQIPELGPQEALVNESVAGRLGLRPGDDVALRVPRPSGMPLDAPLARGGDKDAITALVTVRAVLPDAMGGRFSLAADQAAPGNLFVDRAWLQELLELPQQANLLLVGGDLDADAVQSALARVWRPEQAGFSIRTADAGVVQLESSRIFLEDAVVLAVRELPDAQPALTYLVNRIGRGDKSTPYSFVAAGPVPPGTPEGAVVVGQWLADNLGVAPGGTLDMEWYEVGPSNEFITRQGEFPVHAVLPMEALAAERALAPKFPGLSDVDSCRDWDIGMPLDEEALDDPANEAYWKAYGQTPKLMVSFETGEKLWGGRFGAVMAVRFPAGTTNAEALAGELRARVNPEDIGLAFMPVRELALRAVDQAMDFGGLFTGMSFFLIIAALVLLGLLFAHGMQRRAAEMGTLLALGWTPRRVRALFLLESLPALLAGVALGTLAGGGYAWLLMAGLARFWPGAVAGAALRFHAGGAALATGAAASLACALAVVALSLWRAGRHDARTLLTRDLASVAQASPPASSSSCLTRLSWLGVAAALSGAAAVLLLRPENPSGAFFGIGFLLLLALLGHYARLLGWMARRPAPARPRWWKTALTQLARRRGRSLGVAVMTACGCFLVLSVSAMRANMALHAEGRASGTGGFGVYAETTLPVRGDAAALFGVDPGAVLPLRMRDGEDAGCLNLNRAQSPRLLGVDPARLAERGSFAPPELWALLGAPLSDGAIPALVGDSDTAMWGLQAVTDPARGTTLEYRADDGRTVAVRLVGRLPMRLSVFQGMLLVSEENFTRLYPGEAGHRAFLLDTPSGGAEESAARLNRDHARLGIEAQSAVARLRAFYAVETAYLAMFLVLGGLGMALGAGGAGVVVLRNLFERRAELALLLALGYTPARLRLMLGVEHGALVAAGILGGAVAAAVAVVPLIALSQTTVSPVALVAVVAGVGGAYLAAAAVALAIGLRGVSVADLRGE